MKREIITTADGTTSFFLPECNETYHSKHGALQEAVHVFINHGLHYYVKKSGSEQITLLEAGFGTGLNALLTLLEGSKLSLKIQYEAIDAHPLSLSEALQMNYTDVLRCNPTIFRKMHVCAWEKWVEMVPDFVLKKRKVFFETLSDIEKFDLIYYDAFGARVRPELWELSQLKKVCAALKPKGVLVTYSSKSSVRKALTELNLTVEKLPGPPGKREMLRAVKPTQ